MGHYYEKNIPESTNLARGSLSGILPGYAIASKTLHDCRSCI